MLATPQFTRRRARHKVHWSRRYLAWLGVGISALIGLAITLSGLLATRVYADLSRGLPSPQVLADLLEPPNGLLNHPTTLYDRSGGHSLLRLENPGATTRLYLTSDPAQSEFLPAALISATLATADPSFFSHPGYLYNDWSEDSHPTLAQQLVNIFLLNDETPSLRRALRERILAAQITSRYGRQKILTWYLNSANYGRLAIGADAASLVYFGKHATQLTLGEAAALAASARSPGLNPLDAPQAAREEAARVLQEMLEQGWISQAQAQAALRSELKFRSPVATPDAPAPAFSGLVLEQLSQSIDLDRLQRGGYDIITSLDYDLQIQATCSMRVQLDRLEGRNSPPDPDDSTACPAAQLLPTLPVPGNAAELSLASGLVALDPRLGQVLAMSGLPYPGVDPAHPPGRPPGSLLTPFVYLTAFTRGFSPASQVWDLPDETGTITNLDGRYHGPLRLRTALANDFLNPAIQVANQLGMENVWLTARPFGLATLSRADQEGSPFLDLPEVTLLQITRAYGVFSNQGVLAGESLSPFAGSNGFESSRAVTILSVKDKDGRQHLPDATPRQQPIITPQLAYLVNHILSDEPARWTTLGHPNPLEIGRTVAAKIGRTTNGKDAWVVGYTPDLVVGVWIGDPGSADLVKIDPLQTAGLWHAIFQYAVRSQPEAVWSSPPGINTLAVCDPSGLLPTPECPAVVNEVFLAGSEPTQADNLFQKYAINRETGLLATVFTPPNLVQEQVFMKLPEEARSWAAQAGIQLPPGIYDVILDDPSGSPFAQLDAPQMFSHLQGKVQIRGSAAGPDFLAYRLQIGKGLNPERWLQIGEETNRPVESGVLGEWDMNGLSGLYSLRLVVIRRDQSVETDIVQVTVDNNAPEVRIIYPARVQDIADSQVSLTLQAEAQDDLTLARVEFYMDGDLLASLVEPPFVFPWQTIAGQHTLLVKAYDQAGNTSEDSVNFSIR